MKAIILVLISFLFLAQPLMADSKQEVSKLVEEKITEVMDLLKNEQLDVAQRNERVVKALTPILDFSRMAKLSLGKKYWKPLKKSKRKEYSKLFIKQVQDSLLEKLGLYTDEKVVLKEAKVIKKKKIYVVAELISQDSKIDLLFKFYKSKKGWKAYDLEILGVSIIQTYRTQFHSIMKRGGIQLLLSKMRESGQFKIEQPSNS